MPGDITLMNPPEPLSSDLQTCMVFAARYTHSRPTGGAYVVIHALMRNWSKLSNHTRKLLISESREATENLEGWEGLRKFALQQPPPVSGT